MKKVEKTYSNTMKKVINVASPIKRKIKRTDCLVHKYINEQAIEILLKNNYIDEYNFYKENLLILNNGVQWADSDFKSANHFYHHEKGIGLYGFSNAYAEGIKYYNSAKVHVGNGELEKALFLLGATCHLVQDTTVPAHAMKNLRRHRPLESFIIDKIVNGYKVDCSDDLVIYDELKEFIVENTKFAVKTEMSFSGLKDRKERFDKISQVILLRACKTTAGLLINFYRSTISKNV